MPIPFTAIATFHNTKASQQAESRRRQQQQQQQRRAEEEKRKKAEASASTTRASSAKASTSKEVAEPTISSRQMLINELTEEFGEPIVSQIQWNAMTPPRNQCKYLKEQEKTKTSPNEWRPEFGGGKRKTRKSKKNKKSCSCKNKKYFFW